MSDTPPVSSHAATWDAMAKDYDAERNADPVYHACIQQAVNDLRPAGVVLDCGCGTGFATRLLLGRTRELHALDFSAASLEELKRKFPGAPIQTAHGDVRKLPYPDGYFDRVLVANVLQHLTPPDQRLAVAEVMRVLKSGGRYSVSVHHFSVEKQRAGWKKEGRPGGKAEVDYIFRYTRDELAAHFPGGKVRAIGFYGWPSQVQMPITRLAGRMLAKWGRGHMLCASGVRV
jgi:SAM-dependent methyltransferase